MRLRPVILLGGVVLLSAALSPPLGRLGEQMFFLHMLQHVVIVDVAALLIVLAAPAGAVRRRVHPAIAFGAWVATLAVWHLPGPYDAALESPPLHALQHLCFLLAGLLLWATILGRVQGPSWFGTGWRLGLVVAVQAFGMGLAQVFVWPDHVLYAPYARGPARWGIAPLTDQRLGGIVMLVEGMAVAFSVFAWLFLRWLAESERSDGQHPEKRVSPARSGATR